MADDTPPKPIIGVTARQFEGGPLPRIGTYAPYLEAVIAAGGAPLVLPLIGEPEKWVSGVVAGLDGVLFTGGEDVEPARYGEAPHERLGVVSPLRDGVELAVFEQARLVGLPIFGICRGLQLINVALGGTLYQDLPTELSSAKLHAQGATEWLDRSHTVLIEQASALARIATVQRVGTNSLHHQAIRDVGLGLSVVGRCATDGTVEAIEGSGPGWLLAVQWHPEVLWDGVEGGPHRAIFEEFVHAAARYREERCRSTH